MRVLEIGCGAGRLTRALAKLFGEVHGVDVSGEMVGTRAPGDCRFPQRARVSEQWLRPERGAAARIRFRVFRDRVPAHPEPRRDRKTTCAKCIACCVRARSSNFRCREIPRFRALRKILGLEFLTPMRRRWRWRIAADSSRVTGTAPATSISGSGFSRSLKWDCSLRSVLIDAPVATVLRDSRAGGCFTHPVASVSASAG